MTEAELAPWVNGLLAQAYRPKPDEKIKDWGKRNVYVPPEVSPEFPGFYDSSVTPLVEIMFEFKESPDWDEFFSPKSSQSGESQAAHVIIMHDATFVGKNIILALDSREEAKRVSQGRLQPLIRHCDAIQARVSEDADDLTNLTLRLKGLTIFLMGSHSPSALANKTAALAIADEVDNYPDSPQGESNAIDLLRERLKKVIGSKLIAFSKPKNEDNIIWPEYLTGSRHKCFLPCPHCHEEQELVWEQVKFDHCKNVLGEWDYERVLKETYYECIHCEEPIEERHKPKMLADRNWQATNKGQDKHKPKPRKMSAHISDLYSIFQKDTWGHLAIEWLDAQGNVSKQMAFRRGRLALPWSEKKIHIGSMDIKKMVGGYRRGQCPLPPDVVLMSVDVQKDVKKWTKCGWRLSDETCWIIDYGETLSYSALQKHADEPVEILHWPDDVPEDQRVNPTVYKGVIDEGYDKSEVRDFVIDTFLGLNSKGQTDFRFYSCFNRAGVQTSHWKDLFDVVKSNHKGWELLVYKFDSWAFLQEIINNRLGRFGEILEAQRKKLDPPQIPRYWWPVDIDNEYIDELCQEARVWDEKKKKWVWQEAPRANDHMDGLKMNTEFWFVLMPVLWKLKLQSANQSTNSAQISNQAS